VAIACPYCDHRIQLRGAKPGRFRPKCPRCDQAFALLVPKEPGAAFEIHPIPEGAAACNNANYTHPDRPAVPRSPATPPLPVREVVAVGTPLSESSLFGVAATSVETAGITNTPLPPPRAPRAPRKEPREDNDVEPRFTQSKADVKGYRIERELGRGGMGYVFLARQLSLDRLVALKVMARRWASDPVFVARFTREAFAAAQLSHPNIVHIHDIGEVNGSRFFSMEYVAGQSLADVIRSQGKLDPEIAVGYILQAARGLKHAHDRGMIHRDVKPDNLLLDDQGLVKVADLGLVKTNAMTAADDTEIGPRSGLHSLPADMTGARIALGTPAYMSPEQCRDAATVDHRADIYSLGCTLYVLVTGRPPFDGTTAVELMTKQAYEPIIPPEQIVSRVPPELSAVIQRMMAKSAADRFQNMGEVIRTLEAWLGINHSVTFSPREEQIDRLECEVTAFNSAPSAILARRVTASFFALTLLPAVLLPFFGQLGWAFGLVGLAMQTTLAYFILDGVTRKGHLFVRVRQFVLGLGWSDRGIAVIGLGLFVLLLWLSGVFWIWAGFGLIGVGLAFGMKFWLDRKAADERQPPLDSCEKLLRRLRGQGLDEEDIRQFVAKFSGRHWEEFFESLFGFEAKMTARAMLLRGGAAGRREKYAAWREPILSAIDRIEEARKSARERKLLQSVEQARFQAEGLLREEAEQKAQAAADALVREADRVRRAEAERAWAPYGPQPAAVAPLVSGASHAEFVFGPAKPDPVGQTIGFFVGPHVRAILAAVLIAACGIWAYQNAMFPGAELQAQAQSALEANDLSKVQVDLKEAKAWDSRGETQPLVIDGIAPQLTAWVDSFNVGLAGLLLLLSLLCRGNVMSLLVLLGAGLAVSGHHPGMQTVGPVQAHHVALLLGTMVALVGYRIGRR
jgi:serine/threonine protein kinase